MGIIQFPSSVFSTICSPAKFHPLPISAQISSIRWQLSNRVAWDSSETCEAIQWNDLFRLLHPRAIGKCSLPSFAYINTATHDRLVSKWLTGEREYAAPPTRKTLSALPGRRWLWYWLDSFILPCSPIYYQTSMSIHSSRLGLLIITGWILVINRVKIW